MGEKFMFVNKLCLRVMIHCINYNHFTKLLRTVLYNSLFHVYFKQISTLTNIVGRMSTYMDWKQKAERWIQYEFLDTVVKEQLDQIKDR